MAFFTAIGGAIAGVLFGGSTIAASIIGGGLAFGTSLVLNYLTRPKQREYAAAPTTAVQGSREYGARVGVGALFGIGKVQGHHIYYAKWGEGNKFNADVFVLSNFRCRGLAPVVIMGDGPRPLVEREIIGNEHAHYGVEGFGNAISIRFYDGRPGQGVDTKLVSDTSSLGQNWKPTSTCAGMCYVVVEREWSAELFPNGEPRFEWILEGLRCYDPRKDSTIVGGSGSHRVDDSSTWEYTQNPAVQRLNYELGFRGLVSNRVMLGMGKSLGQIDLGSYIAAMNVCDTIRGELPTYMCSLWVTSDDDHTEILREFDDAMAGFGMNRRGLSGVIAGAPQTPTYELTEEDIDMGRPKSIKRRKSAFDLYNHISGQFISPEALWNPESLKPIKVNQHISDDGRERQIANDFLQVVYADIAQYLLQIRYRQQRKGGSAKIPVSRRFGFRVQEGEWIEFLGLEWQITQWSCDDQLQITLTLAETGADIYSSGGLEPGPIVVPPTPPINPSVLTTVQNFNVEVGSRKNADGVDEPCLRFSWTPPNDPTIDWVRFEYFKGDNPSGQQILKDAMGSPEDGEHITSKDVEEDFFYTARATIVTRPDRFKTWTPYATTSRTTPRRALDEIVKHQAITVMQEMQLGMERLAGIVANLDASTEVERQRVVREFRKTLASAEAYFREEINIQVGPNSAIAQALTDLRASIDNVEANLSIRYEAAVDTQGAIARYELKATAHDAVGGLEILVLQDTLGNKIANVAVIGNQFFVKNGDGSRLPMMILNTVDNKFYFNGDMFIAGGIDVSKIRANSLSALSANIGTATAGYLLSPVGKFQINLYAGQIAAAD